MANLAAPTFAPCMEFSVDLSTYWQEARALSPIWGFLLGLYGLAWGVQLYFWLARFSKVARYKTQNEPTAVEIPEPISVIVCCHNDLAGLQALLQNLAQQSYPRYEVIVVDDRSDDETYDWLLTESRKPQAGFRLVRVNERPEHVAGKKYALTLGIKAAMYDSVLLTDADCLPTSSDWVSRMAAALQVGEHQVVLGYGPHNKTAGLLNVLIRYDTFYTALQYIGFALAGKPYMGVGRNLAYRKSLFFDTKGFAAHAGQTGGDDDLFINQAVHEKVATSFGLCLHADSQTISAPKTTFRTWFVQKRRHLSAGKQYHATDKWALGLLQVSHILFYCLGVALLFAPPLGYVVGVAYLLRLIVVWIVQFKAAKRLTEKFPPLQLPLLDAWMPAHYLVFGIPALISKRVVW